MTFASDPTVDQLSPHKGADAREFNRLAGAVEAMARPAFAVVDGGHFDDAPKLFSASDLKARSLFLEQTDPDVLNAGPWLVPLGQVPDAANRVFAIVADKPAVVFWSCPAGEQVLWRHLRTINQVQIPATEPDGAQAGRSSVELQGERPGQPQPANDSHQPVLFRHWDPTVLALVLPILKSDQFSRVLGPAQEIALYAPESGGFRRALRTPDLPPAPNGMLRMSQEQIIALETAMARRSHQRIATYLQDVAPEKTALLHDGELLQVVRTCEDSGARLGLTTEQAFGRWAYLMLMTDGKIARSPEVCRFIADGDDLPDRQVKHLITHTARAMSAKAGG